MLKKSLSVLSGSLILASTPSHSISIKPGDNVFMVFNTTGQGSYWLDLGLGTNEFMSASHSPNGFSIDLTGAAAALGGTIESFALMGNLSGEGKNIGTPDFNYNYNEFIYVDLNGGLITNGADVFPEPTTNASLDARLYSIDQHLQAHNISTGYYAEGSEGDADSFTYSTFLSPINNFFEFSPLTDSSYVYLHQHLYTTGRSTNTSRASKPGRRLASGAPEACLSEHYDWEYDPLMCHYLITYNPTNPFTLDGDVLTISGNGSPIELTTAVPIPAASWLFLSAGFGLFSLKKINAKKSTHYTGNQ